MQTFFTALYATLIGFFQNQKPAEYGLYKTVVFSLVGWQTLGLTLVVALFFYYVVYGRPNLGPQGPRKQTWFVFLLLVMALGATLAAYVSVKQGAVSTEAVSRSYRIYFAMANGLVAAFAFLLWSVIFARPLLKSRNAQGIPF